jgi:hypothetical protein
MKENYFIKSYFKLIAIMNKNNLILKWDILIIKFKMIQNFLKIKIIKLKPKNNLASK